MHTAYDRLQADHSHFQHAAASSRKSQAAKQDQCLDKLYEQQGKVLRLQHAEGELAVKRQISLQAINTQAYTNKAQQQHLNHTHAMQKQQAAHMAELAVQKAAAAELYQALHNKCTKQQQAISVQNQRKHADKIKHSALLSAATIHLQQPTTRAERVRLVLLAKIKNHTLAKHLPAMLIKGKPGPKPADITPSTPTVGLRTTQVGNANPTSAHQVKLVLKMSKLQTDERIATSCVTDCSRGAAEMILADAYPYNFPGQTTLQEARKITDALYIRAITSESQGTGGWGWAISNCLIDQTRNSVSVLKYCGVAALLLKVKQVNMLHALKHMHIAHTIYSLVSFQQICKLKPANKITT